MNPRESEIQSLLDAASDRGWLVGLSRRLLADESRAEDAASRAILAALDHPPRALAAMRAWLATTARNFARKERREQWRRDRRETSSARREVVEVSPAELVAIEETRRRVVAAVLALPAPQREVILLRHWSGLTSAEIASRKNENESTVRNRLKRAHERLREVLDSEYGDRASWRQVLLPLASPGPFVPAVVATSSSLGGWLVAAKTKLTIVAMCLAIGVASYLFLEPDDRDSEGARSERSASPSPTSLPTSPGRDDSESATDASLSPRDAVGSLRSVAEPAPENDRDVHVVRILRGGDRSSVPLAEVKVKPFELDPRRSFNHRRSDGFFESWDPERDLANAEARFANERGEIELVADGTRYYVGARVGDEFGFLSVDTSKSPRSSELLLSHDPELRVEVVDSRGSPVANEPVALEFTMPSWPRSHVMVRADSDERGIAVLRHLVPRKESRQTAAPRYFVTLGGPYSRRPEVPIDLESEPLEVVRLIVPDSGRVEIEFTTDDGVPYRELLGVGVGRAPLQESVFPQIADLVWFPARDGRVSFSAGLDSEVGIYVCAPDESRDPVRVEFSGPKSAGEVVRRTVAVGKRRPELRGRLIDSVGVPLSHLAVSGEYTFGDRPWYGGESYSFEAFSDEHGNFALPISKGVNAMRPETIVLTIEDRVLPSKRRAVVALGEAVTRGDEDVELGEIVALDPPQLAAGRVVDELGAGIAGARVGFEFMTSDGTAGGLRWFVADANGSFDVRDWLSKESQRLRLRAAIEGRFVEATPEVELGATGVELRLSRGGALHGSFLVEPGFDPNSIRIELRSDGLAESPSMVAVAERGLAIAADGSFSVSGLRPGNAALDIHDAGDDRSAPLLSIENLVVDAGITNRDPRIQAIALSNVARRIELSVVDAAGRPLEGALVRMRPGDATSGLSRTRFTDASGNAALWIPRTSHSLLVTKPGYRTVYFPVSGAAQHVTLEAGVELRVSIQGITSDAPRHELRLMPAGEGYPDIDSQERWLETGEFVIAPLGPDGKATLFVVQPGSYALELTRESGPGRVTRLHRRTLDVSENEGVREIVIDLADGEAGDDGG